MNTTGTDWLALGAWTARLCLLALFAAELQAGEGLGADQGFKTGPMASHSGNLDHASWTQITNKAAFSPRDTAEGIVFAGRMWLSNGYYHGNKLTRDLWSSRDGVTWNLVLDNTPYDGYSENVWTSTDGKNWRQLKAEPQFAPRHEVTSYVHDGSLWVVAGNTWPVVNDVWRLTLGTDQE